jgi:hypothetical protein
MLLSTETAITRAVERCDKGPVQSCVRLPATLGTATKMHGHHGIKGITHRGLLFLKSDFHSATKDARAASELTSLKSTQ